MNTKMLIKWGLTIALSVAAVMAFGQLIPRADGEGSAIIIPGRATIPEWGTQQVIYTVGSSGISQGGGVKIQFPKSWHAALNPLSLDPTEDYYVSATTSRPGAEIVLSVAHVGIDGREDTMDFTATLTMEGQDLVAGDIITYTFGDQSGEGRGVRPGAKAGGGNVRIASDSDGDGSYIVLTDPLQVKTVARSADHLAVVAPSIVTQGTPFALAVVAQDEWFNAADGYTGTVSFSSTDQTADLPAPYTFTPADRSIRAFTVTLNTLGSHWITVTDPVLTPGGVNSNPIDCRETAPSLQPYWGDIHSHTDFSHDAYGFAKAAFDHARDIARLDFYGTTDHTYAHGVEYTPSEWEKTRRLVSEYYQPGKFVTLLSYEWTIIAPYGHHNVYFRGTEEEILRGKDYPTLEELWAALEDKEALTIPHSTGKRFTTGPSGSTAVDWSYGNEQLQTTVEIYSKHGQSEYYDPDHPLSYENLSLHGTSVAGPHYAQDAWAAGQQLGVIASTDDHSARPGQPHRGLAAVYVEDLTREAIFDAIAAKHTYATTGQRILLDFKVDGHMMGESYTVTLPHSPAIEVRVVGTDLLDFVEVVKYDGITYTVPYSVTQPGSREVCFTYVDSDFKHAGLYYVRLQQVNEVEGRIVMAWSSPVWVSPRSLTVEPLTLSAVLNPGDTATRTLTISNAGTADLTWGLAENPPVGWLSEAPTNGTVAPSDSTDVAVSFDATGLGQGDYSTDLVIYSNAPDDVTVPVFVEVQEVELNIYLPLIMRNY
jgi:hypothetical protein